MKKSILIAIYFIFHITLLQAQEYHTHHYTVYDGLPSPEIYDITQDTLGQIWFATRRGVITYDGFHWEKIKTLNETESEVLNRIAIDERGIIWLTGHSPFKNILYLKKDGFHAINIPDSLQMGNLNPRFFQIVYGSDDQPWIFLSTNSRKIILYHNGKFKFWDKYNSPFGASILNVERYKNQFYVLSMAGLFSVAEGKVQRIKLPEKLAHENFLGFKLESVNPLKFWLLTAKEVFHVNQLKTERIPLDIPIKNYRKHDFYQIISDDAGGVFISTNKFLKHYNAYLKRWEQIIWSGKYFRAGVNKILKDREHNFWFATMRGVFKIPSLRFLNFYNSNGLFHDEVTSIKEFYPGLYFFGQENGFSIYDGKHFIKKQLAFKENDEPFRILNSIPVDNHILATVTNLGLVEIYPNGTFKITPSPDHQSVYSINKSPDGTILIGTGQGLYKYVDEKILPFFSDNHLPHLFIRKIYISKQNDIYLATSDKLVRISSDKKIRFFVSQKYPQANNIYSIFEERSGKYLIGTLAGLFEISGDSLKRSSLFKKNIPIYAILKDTKNNFWLGTDQGIFIIPPDGKTKHFDVRNGIAGMECNRDALYQDSKGRIWIGTSNGLSLYQPVYDIPAPPPLVRILKPFNSGIELYNQIKRNHLFVYLNCISFKNEANIGLRYRLKGFENWHYIPKLKDTKISYVHLKPHTYQFQVQARNIEGIWSKIITSPSFEIPTPFWQTWHFIIFSALFFLALFYFFIYTYQKTQLTRKLEKEIAERTKALKESEQKYRRLFMDSLDGIFITTPEGKFIDVNPAGVKFFGYESKEELRKINIPKDLYVNPEDRERFKKEIAEKGHVHNFEVDFKRKDGKIVTGVISSTCEYDENGSIKAYTGYIRDITEWKEMKQHLAHSQRMESLGLLAGGIAHDFNNILAGILGYASLMKMRLNPDDKMYHYVDIIEKSSQRAAELTNQLLIFSRRGQYKLTTVDVHAVINDSLKIIKPTFPKSIELKIDLDANVPKIVADPTQLQQMIINLAVNARDAILEGEGEITIATQKINIENADNIGNPDAKPGEYVCLKISDTGMGIPDEIKQKIFEPFFSTKPKGKGTGMGLAMVYGMVRNLGGFIQLHSKINVGTTFEIYLPVRTQQVDELVKEEIKFNLKGSEHILVVDDEEMVRNFCKLSLTHYGYQVSVAENGKHALQILNAGAKFDLIILDMIMPVMNGVKTYKKIREFDKKIKFLISSGYSDSEKLNQLKKDTFVDIIFKPYKANELVKKVRMILDLPKEEDH